MRRASPRMREVAERLVSLEAAGRKSPDPAIPVAFLPCEKLRLPLATLLGDVGFTALLSRALSLAATEVKWLSALHVEADGSLGGWTTELPSRIDRDTSRKGGAAVLAQLLGLLATFVGEELTLSLVREAWPKLAVDSPDLLKGGRK